MKKLLLVMMVLLFAKMHAGAQSVAEYTSVGPVVGFGNSWVGNMGGGARFMPSPSAGIGFITARHEHWGFGGQLLISGEGYNVDYSGGNAKASVTYLTLPLRGYYFFGSNKDLVRPNIFLGPEAGVKLGENDRRDMRFADVQMARNTGTFRTMDLGLDMGAGLNIRLKKAVWLNLDLVYNQGLVDVVKDPMNNYNVNHDLGINAGLYFGIR